MKERTHSGRPGGVTTADRPSSADDIDLERIVWDPEYRRAIKPLLSPGTPVKRLKRKPGPRGRRRHD